MFNMKAHFRYLGPAGFRRDASIDQLLLIEYLGIRSSNVSVFGYLEHDGCETSAWHISRSGLSHLYSL